MYWLDKPPPGICPRTAAPVMFVKAGRFDSENCATFATLPRPTAILSSVCQVLSPRQYCEVVPAAITGSEDTPQEPHDPATFVRTQTVLSVVLSGIQI